MSLDLMQCRSIAGSLLRDLHMLPAPPHAAPWVTTGRAILEGLPADAGWNISALWDRLPAYHYGAGRVRRQVRALL